MSKEQMDKRIGCDNYSIFSKGKLLDYELKFNKTPKYTDNPNTGYANIESKTNSVVEGIIYEMGEDGISRLDSYEGVSYGHYYKKELIIQSSKGAVNCIVYLSDKTAKDLKPKKEYLNRLLAGRDYLSPEYLELLENVETVD